MDLFDLFLVGNEVIDHLGFLLFQLFHHKILLQLLIINLMTLNFELICPVKKWLKLALAHFLVHRFDILFLIFVKVSFDTFLEADF